MKKGHIILGGGGDFDISFKLDEKYFSLLDDGSKILYIPIALSRTKIGYEACYDWFSKIISGHSRDKDIDFSMLLENDQIPNLKEYNSIYLGGGNTYKLLDYIYQNNMAEKFANFVNCGGVIYGGSAGAIIFGKDIRTVEEENDKNYPNFLGLNIFKDKSIICHYEQSFDQKIFISAEKINSSIAALPEDSGLILNQSGEIIEIVGDVYIFEGGVKKQI
jgi:dipeptidase E